LYLHLISASWTSSCETGSRCGTGWERPLGAYSGKVRIKGVLLEPLPKEILNGFWLVKDEDALDRTFAEYGTRTLW
jgi:hypothetical protein